MGLLRLANDQTTRIPLGTDDYVEVKSDISKRTFNKIASLMPSISEGQDMTIAQAAQFQQDLFAELVVGWSLDAPATVETYLNLAADAANEVDTVLAEHFQSLTPTKDEATKSA